MFLLTKKDLAGITAEKLFERRDWLSCCEFKRLIKSGADNGTIKTVALHYRDNRLIEIAMKHGISFEPADQYPLRPKDMLCTVSELNMKETMKKILEIEPQLAFNDNYHKNPLGIAIQNGNIDIVRLIFAAYEKIDGRRGGPTAKSAVELCCYNALVSAAIKGHDDIVELLLDIYAEIDGRNDGPTTLAAIQSRGYFAFHIAIITNHISTMDILLDAVAKIDGKRYGKIAIDMIKETAVSILLSKLGKFPDLYNKLIKLYTIVDGRAYGPTAITAAYTKYYYSIRFVRSARAFDIMSKIYAVKDGKMYGPTMIAALSADDYHALEFAGGQKDPELVAKILQTLKDIGGNHLRNAIKRSQFHPFTYAIHSGSIESAELIRKYMSKEDVAASIARNDYDLLKWLPMLRKNEIIFYILDVLSEIDSELLNEKFEIKCVISGTDNGLRSGSSNYIFDVYLKQKGYTLEYFIKQSDHKWIEKAIIRNDLALFNRLHSAYVEIYGEETPQIIVDVVKAQEFHILCNLIKFNKDDIFDIVAAMLSDDDIREFIDTCYINRMLVTYNIKSIEKVLTLTERVEGRIGDSIVAAITLHNYATVYDAIDDDNVEKLEYLLSILKEMDGGEYGDHTYYAISARGYNSFARAIRDKDKNVLRRLLDLYDELNSNDFELALKAYMSSRISKIKSPEILEMIEEECRFYNIEFEN